MKIRLIFLSIYLLLNCSLFGQDNMFSTYRKIDKEDSKKLNFLFNSTSFMKNNEYFTKNIEGYTGFGFILQPKIEYYPTPKTRVQFGYHFLKYSGLPNFSEAIPLFRIQHRVTSKFEIVFGNLYGTLEHSLAEPLFEWDRYYKNNVEYGLQFLWKSKHIKSDLWLNWEKFILWGSENKEEFVFANNSKIDFDLNKNIKLYIPFQLIFTHKGGQIDENSGSILTTVNLLGGIGIEYRPKLKFIDKISFEQELLKYAGTSLPPIGDPNHQHYNNGGAIYSKIAFQTKWFNVDFGYWNSSNFIAPRGEYLFSSVSNYISDFHLDNKELITTKFRLPFGNIGNIKLQATFDGYYNTADNNFAHSYGIFLVYNDIFKIKRFLQKDN